MGRRMIGRLTARAVEGLKRPGHFADGGGLYLQVSETGSRSWVFRYQRAGWRREMGLGSFPAVGLKEARGKAATARADLGAGKGPLAEREAERARRLTDERSTVSFRAAAEQFIAAHAPGWRNPKHRQQWINTLATYAHPVIRRSPGRGDRYAVRPARARADLGAEDGDGEPAAGADRGRARLGDGAGDAHGRESGALAGASRQAVAEAGASPRSSITRRWPIQKCRGS